MFNDNWAFNYVYFHIDKMLSYVMAKKTVHNSVWECSVFLVLEKVRKFSFINHVTRSNIFVYNLGKKLSTITSRNH